MIVSTGLSLSKSEIWTEFVPTTLKSSFAATATCGSPMYLLSKSIRFGSF